MANVREIFEIVDRATRPLRDIESSMGAVVNQTINVNIQLQNHVEQQTRAEESIRRTERASGGLTSALGKMAAAFMTIRTVQAAFNLADELTLAQARINAITGDLEETQRIQNLIYQAAQRSRGEYIGMMQTVSSLKAQTGDTFSSLEEAIGFTELLQKQFKIAGTDATGISSTMYNLTQALSTGVLRGQDLNIVMSNAPQIAQRIARYMGLSVGQLKEVASQGQVTSDIVKNAMLSGADEINEQFAQMPMTFSDGLARVKNSAIRAFQPVGEMMANAFNSPQTEQALNGLSQGLYVVLAVAGQFVSFFINGLGMIANALGFVTSGIGGVGAVMAAVVGFIVGILAGAAAVIVNIFVTIGNIGIELVETLQNNWAQFCFDTQTAIIDFASGAIRAFANVVRGAENAASAIAEAFIAGANAAIGGINGLINAINQIPGVNLSTVSEVSASAPNHDLSSKIESLATALDGMKPDAPVFKMYDRLDTVDVGAAFNRGKNAGSSWVNGIIEGMNAQTDYGDYGDVLKGIENNTANAVPNGSGGNVGKVGKVGKVDNVKLSDEDMKIYRDLAERRYMNNIELKTLAPEINVTLPAGASGNISAQDVADRLKRMLIEQMAAQTAVAHG